MLTLIQFPWSSFCITIRQLLKRHHIPFKLRNIAFHDRAPIITATQEVGYTVPCLVNESGESVTSRISVRKSRAT